MARRHRTRRARQQRKRRLTRKQRGGAASNVSAWLKELENERTLFKGSIDPDRGSMEITYPFAKLKSQSLTLSPPSSTSPNAQATEKDDAWHIDVPFATKDIRAIAAQIRGFIGQYIEGGDVSTLTERQYIDLLGRLSAETQTQEYVNMLTVVETVLRRTPIEINNEKEFPMYFWYLMVNADPETDAAPILIQTAEPPTPDQPEPAAQAE
jgi:hypothetical protein